MKEKPILFNAEMVRAVLGGKKTQTRRVIKPQPQWDEPTSTIEGRWADYNDAHLINYALFYCAGLPMGVRCPYGQPGDQLWVRETFNADWCSGTLYKADGGSAVEAGYDSEPKWKPSIHMPRWASRINLLVKDIRVERVQDITLADVLEEGVPSTDRYDYDPVDETRERCKFSDLWDSINEKRGYGWKVNPWVWVVNFERLK